MFDPYQQLGFGTKQQEVDLNAMTRLISLHPHTHVYIHTVCAHMHEENVHVSKLIWYMDMVYGIVSTGKYGINMHLHK